MNADKKIFQRKTQIEEFFIEVFACAKIMFGFLSKGFLFNFWPSYRKNSDCIGFLIYVQNLGHWDDSILPSFLALLDKSLFSFIDNYQRKKDIKKHWQRYKMYKSFRLDFIDWVAIHVNLSTLSRIPLYLVCRKKTWSDNSSLGSSLVVLFSELLIKKCPMPNARPSVGGLAETL